MKKLIVTLALSSLVYPVSIQAAEKAIQPESNAEKIQHESLTLMEEKYDGNSINRIYQYNDSKRPYIQTIEVPKSIQKEVKKSDSDAVEKVTSMLANYYDDVDNVIKLNEVLYMYIPHKPESKINISESYQQTVSDNLFSSLSYIEKNNKNDVPKSEIEELKETYGPSEIEKEIIPHKTKENLYKETKEFANELDIKWYENKWTYIISGIVILISLFIVFILRFRR